jgi:hypothetical protein
MRSTGVFPLFGVSGALNVMPMRQLARAAIYGGKTSWMGPSVSP